MNGNLLRKTPFLFLGNDNSLLNLGTFSDVFAQDAPKAESIEFRIDNDLHFKSESYEIKGKNDKDEDRKGKTTINGFLEKNNFEMPLFSDDQFQYLSADRISPREDFPRFESDELLGKDGRFTPHFLEKYGNQSIPLQSLLHEKEKNADSLSFQVNAWMRDISPGIEILVKENQRTNRIELSYLYRGETGVPTQDRKPQNVGHGITPTLPLVVALLSAKKDDLIIIKLLYSIFFDYVKH